MCTPYAARSCPPTRARSSDQKYDCAVEPHCTAYYVCAPHGVWPSAASSRVLLARSTCPPAGLLDAPSSVVARSHTGRPHGRSPNRCEVQRDVTSLMVRACDCGPRFSTPYPNELSSSNRVRRGEVVGFDQNVCLFNNTWIRAAQHARRRSSIPIMSTDLTVRPATQCIESTRPYTANHAHTESELRTVLKCYSPFDEDKCVTWIFCEMFTKSLTTVEKKTNILNV